MAINKGILIHKISFYLLIFSALILSLSIEPFVFSFEFKLLNNSLNYSYI